MTDMKRYKGSAVYKILETIHTDDTARGLTQWPIVARHCPCNVHDVTILSALLT